jgi:Ankyrin repeats (many copies)
VLLEHDADANAQNKNKLTPLHFASRHRDIYIAFVLLFHGADVHAQDKNKSTPLHWASEGGHVAVAQVLIRHGADVSAQDKNKSTPLYLALQCSCHFIPVKSPHASSCRHSEVVRFLRLRQWLVSQTKHYEVDTTLLETSPESPSLSLSTDSD